MDNNHNGQATQAVQANQNGRMPDVRMPEVGQVVVWHDPRGRAFNALVTCVWTATCLNLVIISDDEERKDAYGRQIERHTSQVHKSQVPVHGAYWRFWDETPNAYTPPVSQ